MPLSNFICNDLYLDNQIFEEISQIEVSVIAFDLFCFYLAFQLISTFVVFLSIYLLPFNFSVCLPLNR